MATEHALFTAALGLSAPWEVSDIRFDAEAKEANRARVESATTQQLLTWTDRILDAEHVEDIFAGDS